VVTDTLAAYLDNQSMPFVERLLAAMDAGQASGGDKRGKQSAAILIQGPDTFPLLDIRVDDHAHPLTELRRLYDLAKVRHLPFCRAFPTSRRPFGVTDRNVIEKFIAAHSGMPLTELGEMPDGE